MDITLKLNGKTVTDHIDPDLILLDFLRAHGCFSVKRGCDTSNCGLCTVFMDGKPVLSCSMLAIRASGHHIQTLEGLQEEASDFIGFIADQGADPMTVLFLKAKKYFSRYNLIKCLCVIYCILIPFSRIYIGMHYPFDVLVGGVIGMVCGVVVCRYLEV